MRIPVFFSFKAMPNLNFYVKKSLNKSNVDLCNTDLTDTDIKYLIFGLEISTWFASRYKSKRWITFKIFWRTFFSLMGLRFILVEHFIFSGKIKWFNFGLIAQSIDIWQTGAAANLPFIFTNFRCPAESRLAYRLELFSRSDLSSALKCKIRTFCIYKIFDGIFIWEILSHWKARVI